MKSVRAVALFTGLAMFCVLCGTVRAGLYDGDSKDATSGDIADQDYWWAKFSLTATRCWTWQ